MGETIRETTLRELIAANSVRTARAVGRSGGFALVVTCGSAERSLASTRSNVRLFPNLTNLAVYLRKIGISNFEVSTADYEPGRVRSPRPDRAEALRRTRTRRKQASLFEGQS